MGNDIRYNVRTPDLRYDVRGGVVNIIGAAVTPDATATTRGIVKLAGDLGGTADLPTVPALATKMSKAVSSTATAIPKFSDTTGSNLIDTGVKITTTNDVIIPLGSKLGVGVTNPDVDLQVRQTAALGVEGVKTGKAIFRTKDHYSGYSTGGYAEYVLEQSAGDEMFEIRREGGNENYFTLVRLHTPKGLSSSPLDTCFTLETDQSDPANPYVQSLIAASKPYGNYLIDFFNQRYTANDFDSKIAGIRSYVSPAGNAVPQRWLLDFWDKHLSGETGKKTAYIAEPNGNVGFVRSLVDDPTFIASTKVDIDPQVALDSGLRLRQLASTTLATDATGKVIAKKTVHTEVVTNLDTITINHNLGKRPAIVAIDSANDCVDVAANYPNLNTCVVNFLGNFTGILTFN